MNAEEILNEIVDIVAAPSYRDRDKVLKFANEANLAIANRIFLPDLADGFDSVDTVVDDNAVDLPPDYHRGLYLAMSEGKSLDIFEDIKSMSMCMGGISKDAGDLVGVTTTRTSLFYYQVPDAVKSIDLYYYRKPILMTDSSRSFPDGVDDNDDFDLAIIHLASRKITNRIEDGEDGVMINTQNHDALFKQAMEQLEIYARQQGQSFPIRPANFYQWLGTS